MPETHGVSSWSGPGDVPQGNTKDPERVLPASGDVRSMKPSTVFDLDHKRLSRLGQMFPMCLAIASIGPSLLIWFQLENLNMVVNVIWEYIYRIQREVNWQKIFKMETSSKETRDDKHDAKGDYQTIKGNYRGWGL